MLKNVELGALVTYGINCLCEKKPDYAVKKIVCFLEELQRWQKHINLTGFKKPELVVKKLIYEALFVLRFLRRKRKIVDLGSGSGATSIVFSLFLESDIYSVEKNVKKASFQKHIKRLLKLDNLYILNAKIEELSPIGADAIFAKAFGPIEKIVEKIDGHLFSSGLLIIPKSAKKEPPDLPNYVLVGKEKYRLPLDETENLLLLYKKI